VASCRKQELIIMRRQRSNVDRLKLILVLTLASLLAVIAVSSVGSKATSEAGRSRVLPAKSETTVAASPVAQETPAAFQEGCLTCHGLVEPMHATKTGKLEDGRDGQKLSCAFCHGGNPAEKANKELAHVQPRFPDEWKRNNQRTTSNPERTNALLAKEIRASAKATRKRRARPNVSYSRATSSPSR
jgi:hypothetical protein